MSHLVDSDVIISWLKGTTPGRDMLDPLIDVGFAMSVISLMEIEEGIRPGDLRTRTEFDRIRGFITILPIAEQTALIASSIRQELRARKAPIRERSLDILIAATAIEHDLMLVTRNIRHFQDIDGLQIFTSDPN